MRLIGLIGLTIFASSTFAVDGPPRYQLKTGRVLLYSGEGSSKERDSSASASTYSAAWRFTVLAQNPDGSARVLARSTTSYRFGSGKPHESVSSAVFDLYPDGRYRIDPSKAIDVSPETVFPRLPADADTGAKEWQSEVDWRGNRTTFAPQSGGDGEFVFAGTNDGPTNRIYLVTRIDTYHFDKAKGIVTRIDGKLSQDYGTHKRGTGTTKLDAEETIPAADAEALARDYATYTQAVERYDEQMKRANEEGDKAQQVIDSAKRILTAAAGNVQRDEVKQEFKTKLEEHDRYAASSVESAKRLAEVLNKPAAEWSAKDIDDKPIALKDLRGKVVVMDFWYRGCGWCMYSMPQVKRLSADFKDKGVAVLGMNTDRDLDDARFVVNELGLDYPQVQATGIPEKFGVQGFPTLIIIDQQGKVRDVDVGYSPDLYETVSKRVETLLAPNRRP